MSKMKFFISFSVILLLLVVTNGYSLTNKIYIGGLGGYGSTNWGRISSSDSTMTSTMPSSANDDGFTWGLFIGDDINQNFGAEFRYQHFADSQINFAQYNEYNPPNFDAFTMNSKTDNFMFLGKLRVPINTIFEMYSVLGGSVAYRKDQLNSLHGFGGVFGAGSNFTITKHWSDSLEFDFVTGNAAINLAPAQYYQPFLTSFVNKIVYYF